MSSIPVYNVNNNCCSGSSAIQLGYSFIKGELYDCVMALGFEKMQPGSLKFGDGYRENPLSPHIKNLKRKNLYKEELPLSPQLFGHAGAEYLEKHQKTGVNQNHFAKIALKNHLHSVNNPYSQFNKYYSMKEILSSRAVCGPLTKLQCCPTSDGAGCIILASEKFVKEKKLENQAVEVLGMETRSDISGTFNNGSLIDVVGSRLTKSAVKELYKKTGINPKKIGVCELHDCFSTNELLSYEALGLCDLGKAAEFIDKKENTYGGRIVVNPSGGLISKGHPLGATGMAQCAEICWQLRGMAGKRQVGGVELGLQHNLGLGGAVVVALYKKFNFKKSHRKDLSSDPEILDE